MTVPASNACQLWLCLRLHQLALDVLRRALPAEQAADALAVVEQQRIFMPDDSAMAHGVRDGISSNAARVLLPGLKLIERNELAEQQALESLAQHCYRFTPMVALGAPDCVLLEIQGCLRLFGGVQALLAQIRGSVTALGFALTLGLGHTPQAARLLSQSADDALLQQHRLQQHTFTPQDFLPHLHALPLSLVFDDIRQREKLARLGWRTLGDVLAQDVAALSHGLGKTLIRQLQTITGELPDPQTAITPRTDFCSVLHLPFALGKVQDLLYPMQRLLADLQQFLLLRQLASQSIDWRLRDTRKRCYEVRIHVAKPQHRAEAFLALTRLKLEALRLEDDIEVITLHSEQHSAMAAKSGQLFRDAGAGVSEGGDSSLSAVLDRLRARLGDDVCVPLRSRDEELPELATQHGNEGDAGASVERIHDAQTQPLWLLPTPQRLRQGLYYHGALQLVSGAQRIQSYWWQQSASRDYYRAQHADGTLYWVFRQLPGGEWFLHGVYS